MLCELYFTCIFICIVFCKSMRMPHWNKRLLTYLLCYELAEGCQKSSLVRRAEGRCSSQAWRRRYGTQPSRTVHTTRGCAHVRNTPHEHTEVVENRCEVHTDASPYRSAPNSVWTALCCRKSTERKRQTRRWHVMRCHTRESSPYEWHAITAEAPAETFRHTQLVVFVVC